ncbi:MAG: hypothetical protein LBQ54_15560 [Planctomycetaceae bacterium]|nr:hypothetical protein [Planctomycetaceae bacterium]
MPSQYSHDSVTGEQLIQHTPRPEPLRPNDSFHVRQGYSYQQVRQRDSDGGYSVRVTAELWGNPDYYIPMPYYYPGYYYHRYRLPHK